MRYLARIASVNNHCLRSSSEVRESQSRFWPLERTFLKRQRATKRVMRGYSAGYDNPSANKTNAGKKSASFRHGMGIGRYSRITRRVICGRIESVLVRAILISRSIGDDGSRTTLQKLPQDILGSLAYGRIIRDLQGRVIQGCARAGGNIWSFSMRMTACFQAQLRLA
jgi:hypothetical protein